MNKQNCRRKYPWAPACTAMVPTAGPAGASHVIQHLCFCIAILQWAMLMIFSSLFQNEISVPKINVQRVLAELYFSYLKETIQL